MMNHFLCECENPKANYLTFDSDFIGIDEKNGDMAKFQSRPVKNAVQNGCIIL